MQDALRKLIATEAIEMDVLPEATTGALLEAIHQKDYHVIHYVGHGIYSLKEREGFLCLESEVGRTELVSGTQLPRFLRDWTGGLFVISACQSAQIGVLDAFDQVAIELLQQDVPAVLSVPTSLNNKSTIALYRTLYASLSAGQSTIRGLHRSRIALKRQDDQAPTGQRRFDWGVPALYQRTPNQWLVAPPSPDTEPEAEQDRNPGGSQGDVGTAAGLIGRKHELQAVRRSVLQSEANIFYVWGSDGIGKRQFMSRLIRHSGSKPSASCVIHCRDYVEPLEILRTIADFWQSEDATAGRDAGEQLLSSSEAPFERARQAQQSLARKRYTLAFDGIDAWFDPKSRDDQSGDMSDETLRDILLGLLSIPSRTLFFFTANRKWADLDRMPSERRRNLYLPLLPLHPSIEVMSTLPELRTFRRDEQYALHWYIGGHPKAYTYLAHWLRRGNELSSLLQHPPVAERLTEAWIAYLLKTILDELDPGERDVLEALALLRRPFSIATVSELTPVTFEHAKPLVDAWLRSGLVELRDTDIEGNGRYTVHATVREAIRQRLSEDELRARHAQAAAYYGAPFVDAARRRMLARNVTSWSEDRIAWLARDVNGILGVWLRQSQAEATHNNSKPSGNLQISELLRRALAWQHHLMEAGQSEAAAQVVQAIVPQLKQTGQIDLSSTLLQRTVTMVNDLDRTTGMDVLAKLHLDEGHLSAALQVYEDVYQSLDEAEAGVQRAHILMRAGNLHQRLGYLPEAVEKFEQALQISRTEEDSEGEAECLYQLAVIHREQRKYKQALVYSQAAKERYELLMLQYGLAAAEREQGHILRELGRPESALERFAASLQICRRLGDQERIADNLLSIGQILQVLDKTEIAIQVVEEALEHYQYLRSTKHGAVLKLRDELYARQRQLDDAVARFRVAKRTAERLR
jgi:tetratricopeptide (TPR) repeat protein